MKLTIIHKSGARSGLHQSISGKAVICFGRSSTADCVFDAPDDHLVSGKHAQICIENDKVLLADLNSTNGTWLNGQRITEAELTSGDTVQFGDIGPSFIVEYAAPSMNAIPGSSAAKAEAGFSGEEAPKKYGERTMGMLVQKALAQAGLTGRSGTSKSTEYFEALVDEKVARTSKKLKLALIIAGVVVVVFGIIVGFLLIRSQAGAGDAIAASNRYNVFLLAENTADGYSGFCTAFAYSSNVLVTNAHCVQKAQKKNVPVVALMNGAPANRYQVIRMVSHPGYIEGALSPDLGLVQIHGQLSDTITVASTSELSEITAGSQVYVYGFPSRLNKEDAPEATFIEGDIGRVTAFDQTYGDLGNNALLQHSAYTSGGTSGSPMFNDQGHVIGVNAGGYAQNGEILSGYNFGIRIDLVDSLLPMLGIK